MSGFLVNEKDDLRTSNRQYDLSHADFGYYVCFGIAGLNKDEIIFDSESNEKSYTPSILLHYPSEVELPNGVEMFCYPKKVIVKSITTEYLFLSFLSFFLFYLFFFFLIIIIM